MPHQRNPRDRSLIATDRRAWAELRSQILVRDNGRCAVCGGIASEVDHRVPRSQGGTDAPSKESWQPRRVGVAQAAEGPRPECRPDDHVEQAIARAVLRLVTCQELRRPSLELVEQAGADLEQAAAALSREQRM